MLGIDISQATVAKYMIRHPKPPSQNWRTFLDNHVQDLASIDFFTVVLATLDIRPSKQRVAEAAGRQGASSSTGFQRA
jgi:hypothetical protein